MTYPFARPVTRYGRTVVWPDGFIRRLTLGELLLIKLGIKTTVAKRPGKEA